MICSSAFWMEFIEHRDMIIDLWDGVYWTSRHGRWPLDKVVKRDSLELADYGTILSKILMKD